MRVPVADRHPLIDAVGHGPPHVLVPRRVEIQIGAHLGNGRQTTPLGGGSIAGVLPTQLITRHLVGSLVGTFQALRALSIECMARHEQREHVHDDERDGLQHHGALFVIAI